MIELALTGGIGTGKSTVGRGLVSRGAHLIDADAIVRELQRPGHRVLDSVVEAFGPGVLTADGELNRAALGKIVFAEKTQLERLNAIVHPAVRAEISVQRRALAEALSGQNAAVVILDIPLFAEAASSSWTIEGLPPIAGVIVLDASPATVLSRLKKRNEMSERDVRARMAAQADPKERLAMADFVVRNEGTLEALESEIERCWLWIQSLLRPGAGV